MGYKLVDIVLDFHLNTADTHLSNTATQPDIHMSYLMNTAFLPKHLFSVIYID